MAINNTMNIVDNGVKQEQYTMQTKAAPEVNTKVAQSKNGAERELISAIEKANHIQKGTTECQFSIHEDTKQVMIKIIDTTTKEVIKEIPSEEILDKFATMCKVNGLFVDEKM